MRILKVGDVNRWCYNKRIKRFGSERYETNIYERNGLKLTTHSIYKNGVKTSIAKELCDYIGNIISAKIVELKGGVRFRERRI